VEVTRDGIVLKQEPQLTRFGAVIEENLGAVEQEVELLETKHRRGWKTRRTWIGITQILQKQLESLDSSDQRPRVLALEEEATLRKTRHNLAGNGEKGLNQSDVA